MIPGALGRLLLPADPGRRGAVLQADDRWRFDATAVPDGTEVVVWGRRPLPSGTPAARAARVALRRELGIGRLRRSAPAGLRVAAVHRLDPPAIKAGGARALARRVLGGGTLVELTRPGTGPRVVDAIADLVEAATPVRGFRSGSGDAALARVSLADGTGLLLRMAEAGGPGDPAAAATTLRLLDAAGIGRVPRSWGAGQLSGISWSAETLLPGRRPRRLSPQLARAVAGFCAGLPRVGGSPTAPADDLKRLAILLPDRAPSLRRLAAEMRDGLRGVPAVMRHGDLWTGNLLTEGEALVGVVDWDAAHPAAAPCADLLELLATEWRRGRGRSLGSVWLERPWRWDDVQAVTALYRDAVGLPPLSSQLGDLIGIAWWAAEAAGTLRRLEHRAADERWLAANVDPVLSALGYAR